jgi:hypothetical protein
MQKLDSIYSYMRHFSAQLSQRIIETYKPVHGPSDPDSPVLNQLKRKLLPAQKLVVMALAKHLGKADAAILNGECGVGKTFISLATYFVHAKGKRHTGIVMAAPHLVEKWAREVFNSLPRTRVFVVHNMRNGGDPRQPHGITEVVLQNGKIIRKGWTGSLTDLRHMRRKGWAKFCPQSAWFIVGKEKGKLGYHWKHVFGISKCGYTRGSVVNIDTGDYISTGDASKDDEHLYTTSFQDAKRSETITRKGADGKEDGTSIFSALWSADRSKIQRMAPMEYMSRYLKGWFDYAIADEAHELNGDTAQGQSLQTLTTISRKILAMTGTLIGGFADDIFQILFRVFGPRMVREGHAWGTQGRRQFQETYGTIEVTTKIKEKDNRCSKAKAKTVKTKRLPGASPLLFGKFLMDSTAFIFLEDVAEALPSYEEIVVPIKMNTELEASYIALEKEMKDAMREYPKATSSIVSLMLNTLLVYPDTPFGFGEVRALVPCEDGPGLERVTIAEPNNLKQDTLYPKEEWLIEDIRKERALGRRSLVFATYTGEHDVTQRLNTVLTQAGFRVAVLRSTVATHRREAWVEERLQEGVDVVVCHPKLVQTGLDLPAFPTIYFYETGYSLYTLRQASRRSWRIGQRNPVRVKFLHYDDTMQSKCLRLMGKKLMVSLAIEGKFSSEGLQDMGDDGGDILTSLARELVSDGKVGETADAVWSALAKQRESITPTGVAGEPAVEVDVEILPPETEVIDSPAEVPPLLVAVGAIVETQTDLYSFAGNVLAFDQHKKKRRPAKSTVEDDVQLALFA